MDKQWLLVAGGLLAGFLVVLVSPLALPAAHKDPRWPFTAPGVSVGQGGGQKEVLSTESPRVALAVARPLEASPLVLSRGLPVGLPGPLAVAVASSRVTSGAAPPAPTTPASRRSPESQPASSTPGLGARAFSTAHTPQAPPLPQGAPLPSSPFSSSPPPLSHSAWLLSPSPSPSQSPQSPFQRPPTSPTPAPAPAALLPTVMVTGVSLGSSSSAFPPAITGAQIPSSSLPLPRRPKPSPMATKPATPWWTVQPRPMSPPRTVPVAALSLGPISRLSPPLPASDSLQVTHSPGSGGVDPTQAPAAPDPSQVIITRWAPAPLPVLHSVTFRIARGAFSAALWSPTSPESQLLREQVREQLEPVYRKAFPSFERMGVLVCRPDSVTWPSSVPVNVSLVFGGHAPGPTACQVLWILYRKVKASRQMLGKLVLAENSLASDGSTLSDLALEMVSIRFTIMRPFLTQLLVPGSSPFVQLEELVLQQVTPLVTRFCKVPPQEDPLLLFSNADQWVDVDIQYKFQDPVSTHGLASHLAQNVLDSTFQKSSILVNGEKAQLVLYEVWLQILDQTFSQALMDKTSPASQELRSQLTRGLTTILRHLQNLSQVVVQEFRPDPLTARVGATFFGDTRAEALVQDCVFQGLHTLWETEGLLVQMVTPDFVSLLLATLVLVLLLKGRPCFGVIFRGHWMQHTQRDTAQ